jgi:mono/diheme cytochrome c family protein
MRLTLLIYVAAAIALPAHAAMPGDSAEGKKLHDANCVRCHDASIYKSDKRYIKSLRALDEQLEECTHAAEAPLTDDQKKSVLKYLNEQFYKFK